MSTNGPSTVSTPLVGTWQDACKALTSPNKEGEFVRLLAAQELFDYTALESVVRDLERLVRERISGDVQVIPRGSFASRTALRGSVDLDIDLVVPDVFEVPTYLTDFGGNPEMGPIRDKLGVDRWDENITFDRDGLKHVLKYFWTKLTTKPAAHPNVPAYKQMDLVVKPGRPIESWTRSISATTKTILGTQTVDLDIDMFIKVRTFVRNQPMPYIVGVDKDGPDSKQRYQTTQFLPIAGQWYGDRILAPVERCALLTLKWWKNAENLPIKSHHLLSAINALHDLDSNDPLFLPEKRSGAFSTIQVVDVMICVMKYVNDAYNTPCNFLIDRGLGFGGKDFAFPPFAWKTPDMLFVQASADWAKFDMMMRSRVIPNFITALEQAYWTRVGTTNVWPRRQRS